MELSKRFKTADADVPVALINEIFYMVSKQNAVIWIVQKQINTKQQKKQDKTKQKQKTKKGEENNNINNKTKTTELYSCPIKF